MRCKACDSILKPREEYINKKTGRLEELCTFCRAAAFGSESELEETMDSIEDMDNASRVLDETGETW